MCSKESLQMQIDVYKRTIKEIEDQVQGYREKIFNCTQGMRIINNDLVLLENELRELEESEEC